MKWILDNVPKAKCSRRSIACASVPLIRGSFYSLTEGKLCDGRDNASRTMLFDIQKLDWDEKMLNVFGIPRDALPKVVDSSGVVGMCSKRYSAGKFRLPGIAGDQHAALFGQCCFDKGMAKKYIRHGLLCADEHG